MNNFLLKAKEYIYKHEFFKALSYYNLFKIKYQELSNIISFNEQLIKTYIQKNYHQIFTIYTEIDLIEFEDRFKYIISLPYDIYIEKQNNLSLNISIKIYSCKELDSKTYKEFIYNFLNNTDFFNSNFYTKYYDIKTEDALNYYIKYDLKKNRRISELYSINYTNKLENKTLTIIIPCYNSSLYIERCIYSIINQTYQDIEIIIIDDFSTDNSVSIIKKLQLYDKRIKLIQNKNNIGQGKSRNIAINEANGEYITFVDSDDYYLYNNFIADCLRFLKKNHLDALITPYIRLKNNNFSKDEIEIVNEINGYDAASKYLSRKFGTHAPCGKFFRTKQIREIKFIEYGFSQDVMFIFNALLKLNKVSSKKIYGYVYNNENISCWRPKEITLKHIYSSFRLLLEVIVTKHQCSLLKKSLNIDAFIRIWNNDHGKRIEKYISYQHSNDDIVLQVLFNLMTPIIDNILNIITSNKIKLFILKYRNKNINNIELIKDKFFYQSLQYIVKLIKKYPSHKNSIIIYISHLSNGGLERVASNLSFVLYELGYNIIFLLDNPKKVTYSYKGTIFHASLENEYSKYYINTCKFIFDFKYKKLDESFPIVEYCLKNFAYKYIVTIHNTNTCNMYFEKIYRIIGKEHIKELLYILCVSNSVRRKFYSLYGKYNNVKTLYNFIDINQINYCINNHDKNLELKFNDYFLFAGRLDATAQKGIDILIKGFLLSKASENNYLILAGSGKIDEELNNYIINHKNKDHIVFLGFRNDIYYLMKKSKCILAPSRWEGFSMVHLEGLACGVPIISSRSGGAEEIIIHKKNGYLFDIDDINEFINAIDYMQTYAKTMFKCCLETAKKFDKSEFANNINNLLNIT